MSPKSYYPRPWQIPGLLSGEITRVIVPVKRLSAVEHPVNVGNYFPLRIDSHGEIYPAPEVYGLWGDDWDIPAPYQPGDVLAGKETWCCAYHHAQPPVLYKATDRKVELGDGFDSWASPVTMPPWAVRLHLRVLTVEAVRVAEIGEMACLEAGAEFTKHYPEGERLQPAGDAVPFKYAFQAQWEADHGPDAWDGWAWSVQVERVDTGIPASLEKA